MFPMLFPILSKAVARVKKGGSRATRVIKNGPFSFLGCDPGRDFGTRFDPYLTRFWPNFSPLSIDSEKGVVGVAFSIDSNFKNMKMFVLEGVLVGFSHRKVKWCKN